MLKNFHFESAYHTAFPAAAVRRRAILGFFITARMLLLIIFKDMANATMPHPGNQFRCRAKACGKMPALGVE
jgi:hypothetical protein